MTGKKDNNCVLTARTLYHGTEPDQHGAAAGRIVDEHRAVLALVEPRLTDGVSKAPGIGRGERQIAGRSAVRAAGIGKQRIPIDADKEAPELACTTTQPRWPGIERQRGTDDAVHIDGYDRNTADLGMRALSDVHDRVAPRDGNAAQRPALRIELHVSEPGGA